MATLDRRLIMGQVREASVHLCAVCFTLSLFTEKTRCLLFFGTPAVSGFGAWWNVPATRTEVVLPPVGGCIVVPIAQKNVNISSSALIPLAHLRPSEIRSAPS